MIQISEIRTASVLVVSGDARGIYRVGGDASKTVNTRTTDNVHRGVTASTLPWFSGGEAFVSIRPDYLITAMCLVSLRFLSTQNHNSQFRKRGVVSHLSAPGIKI